MYNTFKVFAIYSLFTLSGLQNGEAGGFNSLEKGKSSRNTKIIYESKGFYSSSDKAKKSVSRFTIKEDLKFQINKKNSLAIKMEQSWADLKIYKATGTEKYNVHGFKDVKILHTIKTKNSAKGNKIGIKWKFKIDLPSGKEQLNNNEAKVTSAIGETGQGFENATYGKGLNLGIGTTITDARKKNQKIEYTFGYTHNGNYSSQLGKLSYKRPGDTMNFMFAKTRKYGKKIKQITFGTKSKAKPSKQFKYSLGANRTAAALSFRNSGGLKVSRVPAKVDLSAKVEYKVIRDKRITDKFDIKFQQKGKEDTFESDGQFKVVDFGDPWEINILRTKILNKRESLGIGIKALFAGANFNEFVLKPTPTLFSGAKDSNTRKEEVILFVSKQVKVRKTREWNFKAGIGVTDDARDYVASGSYQWKF
ncbi:MAG: hypothetical protein COB02_17280 [Candidatus Cloacimonadota bacterium]|nr:MAG: hypothetical protein COB02_17280 [Candidatus Cloacimonadota bacterium]